ncbi:MAG: FAD-dependent thymidylate synthase [Candidatus Buchananbacteria bacterium]
MNTFHQPTILAHTQGNLLPDTISVIEGAARTCYKSHDKITDDSAEKLVRALVSRGHESVIEHSWFVFSFDKKYFEDKRLQEYFLKVFLTNNLLILTESDDRFLLSGNARMFRDYFKKLKNISEEDIFILNELKDKIKVLFEDITLTSNVSSIKGISLCPNITYSKEEKMKHWWAVVRMVSSRAFTHHLVRHRRCAFSQESQRYCDESGFFSNSYYIIPPSIENANLAGDYKNKMNQINSWYIELRDRLIDSGKTMANEDARFLLPNAVASEIVMSCNLEEWWWFFKMRCEIHAQWEIRQIALEILLKFKQIFPGCFDDFEIAPDGLSAIPRQ